jgi:hypothetical protein
MLKRRTWLLLALASLAAGGMLLGGRGVQGDEDHAVDEGTGILAADPEQRSVNLGGLSLLVSPGTRFKLNHQRASFEELVEFSRTHIRAGAESEYLTLDGRFVATEVETGVGEAEEWHQRVFGTLVSVDSASGRVVFQPEEGEAPVTVAMGPAAEVRLNDAETPLSQFARLVPRGTSVRVRYGEFDNALSQIKARLKVDHVQGTVTRINLRTGTLSLRGSGFRGGETHLSLLPGAIVLDSSNVLPLEAIRRGDRVQVSVLRSRRHRVVSRVLIDARSGR